MRTHSWLIIVSGLLLAECATTPLYGGLSSQADELRGLYKSSYLHVEGSGLMASNGREVLLHGINIGGWLVTESWMCGFTDSKDTKEMSGSAGLAGRSTLESLEDRFGPERAAALMTAWQDHWVTAGDLDEIHNDGFNLIRVPISYRTLQHADGSWILDTRGQIDFSRMDWIVREAAQRGIYTVFDLHVWPQQRLDQDKIGRADGQDIRESMAHLWTAIAAHYRGNGAIAAFDLINEFPGNWGVQQVLSRAVRDGDPDRVQVIEGFTFAEFLKLHAAGEFPNSIFSEHLYGAKPLTTEEFKSRLKEIADSPVPVYIGEFLAEDFSTATQTMNMNKISWSSWTYKAVDMGDWAIFNYYSDLKTDIQNEDYQKIQAKWSMSLTQWQAPGAPQNYFFTDNRHSANNSEPATALARLSGLINFVFGARSSLSANG
jgi:endoglucanase